MGPNTKFIGKSKSFWAYTKLISEQLGYSKGGLIKFYTEDEILTKLNSMEISIENSMLKEILDYLTYRANLLNTVVKDFFMDAAEARKIFKDLKVIHDANNFTCKLPLNKQKGEKKDHAYFTCIINIITEGELRKYANSNGLEYGKDKVVKFDDDPKNLSYSQDENGQVTGILSRRFDGAYPSTRNPKAIWEIKEYYYTTTFGSRISDGIYETQLDGFEINDIPNYNPVHIYFIDDFNTWWGMGKSYLCRIIDMQHIGLVDEVIFGREALQRWPILINDLVSL